MASSLSLGMVEKEYVQGHKGETKREISEEKQLLLTEALSKQGSFHPITRNNFKQETKSLQVVVKLTEFFNYDGKPCPNLAILFANMARIR